MLELASIPDGNEGQWSRSGEHARATETCEWGIVNPIATRMGHYGPCLCSFTDAVNQKSSRSVPGFAAGCSCGERDHFVRNCDPECSGSLSHLLKVQWDSVDA